MSQAQTPIASSVVAVYPDHPAAERAVRQLYEAGFAIGDISIVGRDFQETDRPYGFVSRSDYAEAGRETGAWFGGLFGFFIGAGFLIFPGLGFVVVAGPIAAAFLAGIEGGLTGTALCGLAGAPSAGMFRKTGAQIRDGGQGGQVSRLRPVKPGGRRSRSELAGHSWARAHRCVRAAGLEGH